jgi:hypothetical protein
VTRGVGPSKVGPIPLENVEEHERNIRCNHREGIRGLVYLRALHRQRLSPAPEMRGPSVSIVLLSGGSANIGWLRELMTRDFKNDLHDAEIPQIPDYQEVVAKGLDMMPRSGSMGFSWNCRLRSMRLADSIISISTPTCPSEESHETLAASAELDCGTCASTSQQELAEWKH